MLKRLLKLSGLVFLFSLLVACSGNSYKNSYKNIEYNSAKSMLGYGYIVFDFSKSNEINYGRELVPGKASYSIQYVKDNDFLSVRIVDAEFDGRILKAYVPFMKGYRLYSVSRLFWYPLKKCESCDAKPQPDYVHVYVVDSISEARCEEATYKNNQKFEYMKGCNNMEWIEKSREMTGSILITPHFQSGFGGMFTPYLRPAVSKR